MRVPYTVNKKILELYQPPTEVITNKGRIQAADFEQWDKGLPRTLKEHCIQTIARNWRSVLLFLCEFSHHFAAKPNLCLRNYHN